MKKIAVLLFDGAEELDYCGPYEVFSIANRFAAENGEEPPFELFTVGEHSGAIRSGGGLRVLTDYSISDMPAVDILVVPGGPGTRRTSDIDCVVEYIKANSLRAEIVASVCTGSFLLARAGLLNGRKATTHYASLERFAKGFPDITVVDDSRVIDEGKVISAGGISSGIDLALHLVARLVSPELASHCAKRIEWDHYR